MMHRTNRSSRLGNLGLLTAFLLVAFYGPAANAGGLAEGVRARIEVFGSTSNPAIRGERLHAVLALPLFYERRTFAPAWVTERGALATVRELVDSLQEAHREGLRPEDYHLTVLQSLLEDIRSRRLGDPPLSLLVDLELLCTDAYLMFGSHLLSGRINPETYDPEWVANRRGADMAAHLEDAVSSGRVASSLQALLPGQAGYQHLRDALARYRAIVAGGGWPEVPPGPALRAGDSGSRVEALRKRLAAAGFLDGGVADGPFDTALQTGLVSFQHQHGLEADGIAGRATIESLNRPLEVRIRQVELNMERWRWLPQDLGERHILVNIAGFSLSVVEGRNAVIAMKVIVGKPFRRTPVFSDRMTYLVLSPRWNLPHKIAVQDKLPLIKKDPSYLASHGMRVFQGWGGDARELDPAAVDWSRLTAGNFPYRLQQDPGPLNALGRIKFMFPNKFDVYLHDTPSRDLFDKTSRPYSSGCIRIEKPLELAEYLLREVPGWPPEKIREAVAGWKEQTVKIPRPVPVHLLYWTVWVDEESRLQFRDDIYGRDAKLDEVLRSLPPTGT